MCEEDGDELVACLIHFYTPVDTLTMGRAAEEEMNRWLNMYLTHWNSSLLLTKLTCRRQRKIKGWIIVALDQMHERRMKQHMILQSSWLWNSLIIFIFISWYPRPGCSRVFTKVSLGSESSKAEDQLKPTKTKWHKDCFHQPAQIFQSLTVKKLQKPEPLLRNHRSSAGGRQVNQARTPTVTGS